MIRPNDSAHNDDRVAAGQRTIGGKSGRSPRGWRRIVIHCAADIGRTDLTWRFLVAVGYYSRARLSVDLVRAIVETAECSARHSVRNPRPSRPHGWPVEIIR